MSLKGFHFVFITAAVLLALGFGYLEFSAFEQGHETIDLVIGIFTSLTGVLLVGYEIWFFKKSRKLIL